MKKTLLVLMSGAILLWASASLAQLNPNRMGLTASPEYPEWCIYGPGMQVYTAQLFILDPVNPEFDGGGTHPVSWIGGFECRMVVEGDATLLGWQFPVDAINAGTNGNTVVGFAEPVPVIDGMALVATLEFFLGNPGGDTGELKSSPQPCDLATGFIYLLPTRPASSIEGMLAYLDADDLDDPLVGANSYWMREDGLVMLLEPYPVDVEEQSWGGIKALYR